MNKHFKVGIIIVVLMLAIGFASITTSMIVNNSVNLGFNSSNFDVYFSSVYTEFNGIASIDSTTRQTITYESKSLVQVDDVAYVDYVVTNGSSQYDARCTVELIIDEAAAEYISVYQTGFKENVYKTINAKSEENGRIEFSLKKVSAEPIQLHFTLKLIFEPIGRNNERIPEPYENTITRLTFDNRPDPKYIPKYEDDGTTLRSEVILDVYTPYGNSDVFVEFDIWDSNIKNYYTSRDYVEFLGKTDNKYSFKIDLLNFPSSNLKGRVYSYDSSLVEGDDYYDFYNTADFDIVIADAIDMRDENDEDYRYQYGVKPWATWYMNEGKKYYCWIASDCMSY